MAVIHLIMKHLKIVPLALMVMILPSTSFGNDGKCSMSQQTENYINRLFSKSDYLYSLLWWESPESHTINAYSFIINDVDMIPIFSSEKEAKDQVAGSGYEKDIVRVKPGLLAKIIQGKEYSIVNPGGNAPVVFKSCIVKGLIGTDY